MKSVFLKFVISLSIYSLFLVAAGIVTSNYLLQEHSFAIVPFVLVCLLFYAVTLIVHYVLLKSGKQKAQPFVRNFIATTFLKLLAYLLILVVYVLLNRENAVSFIITFLILYLFYTVFETIAIMKFFKKRV